MHFYGDNKETQVEKSIIITHETKNSTIRAFTSLNLIRVNCTNEYNKKYLNSIEQTNYPSTLTD